MQPTAPESTASPPMNSAPRMLACLLNFLPHAFGLSTPPTMDMPGMALCTRESSSGTCVSSLCHSLHIHAA